MCSVGEERDLTLMCILFQLETIDTCLENKHENRIVSGSSGQSTCTSSLVPRHQIFHARPAASSKNRVWTLSLVKLGRNHMNMSHQSDCSGKVNCISAITNMQACKFFGTKANAASI